MLQSLANGVVLGSLFAVLAVGLTLVYGVMEVPNFAHAGIVTVAAYSVYAVQRVSGSFWLGCLAALAVAAVVSLLSELVAYRFVRERPHAAPAVALGLLLILDNAMLMAYGGNGEAMSPPYAAGTVRLGPVTLSAVNFAVVVLAVASIFLVWLLLSRTRIGRTIRAVAQDREAAAILGIHVEWQYAAAFIVSGLLAGVAAIAFAPTTALTPYMADYVILDAFVVVVLGGLGSVWGAIAGGLLLGITETVAATYSDGAYQTAFGFAVLVVVLVLRPAGLFSTQAGRTV